MKMISIFDPRAEVKLTTIMLGVSGCIYSRTEQKLKGLGIQGAALSSLLKRLHYMAAKHVEEIWNTRFAASKNTRHYATSTWSKRKRDLHGQPMPDHRKRKKLRQLI
jgi:hypothetical protein